MKVFRYQIYPCKGGWLLNISYVGGTKVESEVYAQRDGMKMLTRIAHIEGLLSESDVEGEVVYANEVK